MILGALVEVLKVFLRSSIQIKLISICSEFSLPFTNLAKDKESDAVWQGPGWTRQVVH